MKKNTLKIAACVLAISLAMVGCGSKKEDNKVEPTKAPEVATGGNAVAGSNIDAFTISDEDLKLVTNLGDYKGYTYKPYDPTVSEEDVDEFLKTSYDKAKEEGAKGYEKDTEVAADKQIAKGDTVNIDFTGYIDDKKFEGGEAKGYNLAIGSGAFIDGFEDQLIGAKIGDKVTVNTKFPEDYYEDLAGKDVKFEVTINYFCQEVEVTLENCYKYFYSFDSYEELRAYLKNRLEVQKASSVEEYLDTIQNNYVAYIISNSEFGDISKLVDTYADYYYETMERVAAGNNSSLSQVVQFMGYDSVDAYKEWIRTSAEDTVKQELVLNLIAKEENITLSEEDYNKYAESYLASTTYQTIEQYVNSYDSYYGAGSFRRNMQSLHYSTYLFYKYAKEDKGENNSEAAE